MNDIDPLDTSAGSAIPLPRQRFRDDSTLSNDKELRQLKRTTTVESIAQNIEEDENEEQSIISKALTTTLSYTPAREYYKNLLDKSKTEWSIDVLNVKPGDRDFVLWFAASSYLPLIAGCFGPIANMCSIAAIVCHWRKDSDGNVINDEASYYIINSVSIVFGIISNLSLYLNFRSKLRYALSQTISLSGWIIACFILLSLVIAVHITNIGDPIEYAQGYWFACLTVILYFLNFILLAVNELGFVFKKYQPVFNINDVQRTLMSQTIFLSVWLLVGAAIFMRMMTITFGDALYFCVVTILTIGLGDYTPETPSSRGLVLIWTTFGLLFFGIIISTIRELVLEYAKNTMRSHRFEVSRQKQRVKLGLEGKDKDTDNDQIAISGNGNVKENSNINVHNDLITEEESERIFNSLNDLFYSTTRFQRVKGILTSLLVTLTYWIMGAVCFYLVEDWSFGTAAYFCYLCLITVGYGVPSPGTDGGKAFFVIWAIFAIPLMTIFISNVADVMFNSLEAFSEMSMFTLSGAGLKLAKRKLSSIDDSIRSRSRTGSVLQASREEGVTAFLPMGGEQDNPQGLLNNAESNATSNSNKTESLEDDKEGVGELENIDTSRESASGGLKQIDGHTHHNHHNMILQKRNPTIKFTEDSFSPSKRKQESGIRLHRQNSLPISVGSELVSYKLRKSANNSGCGTFDNDIDNGNSNGNSRAGSLFQADDDERLDLLADIQVLMDKLHDIFDAKRDKKYSFADWEEMLSLTSPEEPVPNVIDFRDRAFWIGEKSPLRLNFNDDGNEELHRFFTIRYLHSLEIKIQELALNIAGKDK